MFSSIGSNGSMRNYLRHFNQRHPQPERTIPRIYEERMPSLAPDRPMYELLTVSNSMLEKNPGQLLCSLHPLVNCPAPKIMINFINDSGKVDEGTDIGGLSCEFLTKLFKGLVSEKNGPLNFERHLPVMRGEALTVEEKQGYEVIGRLMGICINEPSIRTGSNFPPSFFDALRVISADEAQKGPVFTTALKVFQALEPSAKIAVSCLRSKNLDADGLKNVALNWAYPEGAPSGAEPTQEEIKNTIMRNLKVWQRVQPLFSIAHGLQRSCEMKKEQWDAIRQRGFIDLSQEIQGVAISCEKIKVEGPDCQQKEYFKQWLKEASPDLLELFVYVATGSTTLNMDMNKITIEPANQEFQSLGFPKFSACTGNVIIPEYEDYKTFKEVLETSLEGFRNGGFTIA